MEKGNEYSMLADGGIISTLFIYRLIFLFKSQLILSLSLPLRILYYKKKFVVIVMMITNGLNKQNLNIKKISQNS